VAEPEPRQTATIKEIQAATEEVAKAMGLSRRQGELFRGEQGGRPLGASAL
jgi:hypothetical protein